MNLLRPLPISLLLLGCAWVAAFLIGWLTPRRPEAAAAPEPRRAAVSPEEADEIVRSTSRWGWCKVYFLVLCVGAMYTLAIILFWPVWVGDWLRSPARK
jgi:hypothetical protein